MNFALTHAPGPPPGNQDRLLSFAITTLLGERPKPKGAFRDSAKDRLTSICGELLYQELVYGLWITKTGRAVAFNRGYRPIWERQLPEGPWQQANRNEWVNGILRELWFYKSKHGLRGSIDRSLDAMARLGIIESDRRVISQRYRERLEDYACDLRTKTIV